MRDSTVGLATRELSIETFPDFERFFAQVHGCACTLNFFGRHLAAVPGMAKERAEALGAPDRSRKHFPRRELRRPREAAAVKELVRKRQARGILAYAGGEPVGWCHFGRVDELPVQSEDSNYNMAYASHDDTNWVINYFVTWMDYRNQGVASHALNGAIAAIRKHGGGWVEVTTRAFPRHDPMLAKLRRTYRWHSPEVAACIRTNWPTKEVPGIGAVQGCPTSPRTMGHTGKMEMFEEAGFVATQRDEEKIPDAYHPGDFLVMRRHVGGTPWGVPLN